MSSATFPKFSIERLLAERYRDEPLNKRRDYHRVYMKKWREGQKAKPDNGSQE